MNHSKLLSHLAHAAALSAGLGALFFSLAIALHFDRTVGYLNRNAFSTLLYIILSLFALVCLATAVGLRKRKGDTAPTAAPDLAAGNRASRLCSLVAAIAFVAAMAWECIGAAQTDIASLLRALSATAAAVYFGAKAKKRFAAFGIGVHGYCFFSIATEYFDWTIPMNSPIKTMQAAALVSAMLFMLAELSIRADRATTLTRFGVTAALATVFGITNGVSMITSAIVGDIAPTGYVVRALPTLAIGAYALTRLYCTVNAPELPLEPLTEAPSCSASQEQECAQEEQVCTQQEQEAQPEQSQDLTCPQPEIQESPTINREEQ